MPEKKLFSMQPSDSKMWEKSRASGVSPSCGCKLQLENTVFDELSLHSETQNTNCDAWAMLTDLIEKAASNGSQEFSPGLEMPSELWAQIITLPASISKLTSVKKLFLYSSHLVRVPPEIGDMASLEELILYTSYRLHWMPFEVVRCLRLAKTAFSTRALYGNYKYRPPFPRLNTDDSKSKTESTNCSVCRKQLGPNSVMQVWISLRIGTDVLPLLTNVCSNDCVRRLPPPARGYVDHPHTGGLGVVQPPPGFVPPQMAPV
jgi:hypothetical protein